VGLGALLLSSCCDCNVVFDIGVTKGSLVLLSLLSSPEECCLESSKLSLLLVVAIGDDDEEDNKDRLSSVIVNI
jgi:hypothetical protein